LDQEKLEALQQLVDKARISHGQVDALVSTDGDSDRPLVLSVDPEGAVQFHGGDLLGIIAADFLNADTVVVPVSVNDAVDRWAKQRNVRVIKTRIGSPYVIEAMQQARLEGGGRVVGWEANGGFLTATAIERGGRTLPPLPTRDAALPIIAALCAARERGLSVSQLFARLPSRFSRAGLIDNFPCEQARRLIARFKPDDARIEQIDFSQDAVRARFSDGTSVEATGDGSERFSSIRLGLARLFGTREGFSEIRSVNVLDGVRIFFAGGEIVHIRPSGNAPQLRVYAVADSQARADAIVKIAIGEPEGVLRHLPPMP
jgi:phosphomannomutase